MRLPWRKKTYHDLEFDCKLVEPEAMADDFKADLCAMWGEILFDILEEA